MKIFFSKTGNSVIYWPPLSYTNIMSERLIPEFEIISRRRDFGNQPVSMKSSFFRHCCFNNSSAVNEAIKTMGVEIICFGFWCFLYVQNLFVKKRLEIVLIASLAILLSQKLTSYFC